jgi:hypothetical protein
LQVMGGLFFPPPFAFFVALHFTAFRLFLHWHFRSPVLLFGDSSVSASSEELEAASTYSVIVPSLLHTPTHKYQWSEATAWEVVWALWLGVVVSMYQCYFRPHSNFVSYAAS